MELLNCWEFKKCGRNPGGAKAEELGICSATVETRVNGINRGKNGGRVCWVVSGTLCGGVVQRTFAAKLSNCLKCEFYKLVESKSVKDHLSTKEILAKLKQSSA